MRQAFLWDRVRFLLETAVETKLESDQTLKLIIKGFLGDEIKIMINSSETLFMKDTINNDSKTSFVSKKDVVDTILKTCFIDKILTPRMIYQKLYTTKTTEIIVTKDIEKFTKEHAVDDYDDLRIRMSFEDGTMISSLTKKCEKLYISHIVYFARIEDDLPTLETYTRRRSNKSAVNFVQKFFKTIRPYEMSLLVVERLQSRTLFDENTFEPLRFGNKDELHDELMNVVYHPENRNLFYDERELESMNSRWHIDNYKLNV